MAGVNKVILVGHLGADAEVKNLPSGNSVMNFSVATSESWKDKNGERQERTEWHRCVVMNDRIADAIAKYLKKGTQVYLEGKLQTRKWTDKDGVEKYSTEVMIGMNGTITLLGGGEKTEGQRPAPQRTSGSRPARTPMHLEDEIPF